VFFIWHSTRRVCKSEIYDVLFILPYSAVTEFFSSHGVTSLGDYDKLSTFLHVLMKNNFQNIFYYELILLLMLVHNYKNFSF